MGITSGRSHPPPFESKLLTQYLDYLRDQQCVAPATVVIRRQFIVPFLQFIGELAMPSRLRGLSPKTIHDYVIKNARPYTGRVRSTSLRLSEVFCALPISKGILTDPW